MNTATKTSADQIIQLNNEVSEIIVALEVLTLLHTNPDSLAGKQAALCLALAQRLDRSVDALDLAHA